VITIQRVRVRWTAAARGAPQAVARRGLCAPVMLPSALPRDEVVVHDVLADEAERYERRSGVAGGGPDLCRDLGLSLVARGSALVVDRLPGSAAYPRQSGPARLFTLAPGEVGEYRANFRFTFTTCPCNPSWYYEDQLVLVSHGPTSDDGFLSRTPHHRADHRVHLYGGSRRPVRGSRRA
jgi:hypothetical protein